MAEACHQPCSARHVVQFGAMADPGLPDSIAANVADWTETNAQFTDANAEKARAPQDVSWGVLGARGGHRFATGDVSGLDVVELGCGTAYFSAQLANRGAQRWGVDPTPAQLATARRMMERVESAFARRGHPGSVPLPDATVRPGRLGVRRAAVGRSAPCGFPRPAPPAP